MNEFYFLFVIVINSIVIYLFSLQYFDYPVSFKLEPIYPATKTSKIESRCPKIIHQIVPNINNVPSGLYHTIMHHIFLNPEFEYRIYDYNSAIEILKKDFTPENVDAFLSSNANQIKTDYIKLAFIYKYGGFFIDIKRLMHIKLIHLLKINNVFFIHDTEKNTMDLSLLASHPDNPAIKNAFNKATTNLINKEYKNNYSEITSGKLLGDELFYLGYLVHFTLLYMDKEDNVRLRGNEMLIQKIYKSFPNENITYNLLQDIIQLWNQKLIY
jgi:hypothetical protein